MSDQTFAFYVRQGLYTFLSLELETKDRRRGTTLYLAVGGEEEAHSKLPSLENPSR